MGEVNVKMLWIRCTTNPQQIEVMELGYRRFRNCRR